jgi:hypothetical protein
LLVFKQLTRYRARRWRGVRQEPVSTVFFTRVPVIFHATPLKNCHSITAIIWKFFNFSKTRGHPLKGRQPALAGHWYGEQIVV